MKKITIFSICCLIATNCTGQKHDLLSFFDNIKQDSIVNSLDFGLKNIFQKDITDSVSIYYFFENNEDNLYGIGEAYNMDYNTYTEVKYKRTVTALFSKKTNKFVILCYWIDEINYLAIYDVTRDFIVSTYPFCKPTTGQGEDFLHSILFANNYIFTIETTEKTRIKLIEIDYINGKFNEHKNIIMDDFMIIEDMSPNNEKYNKALKLAGISETGELLEENP
jgi:hypothetical protein